jgi:hypothetical protein
MATFQKKIADLAHITQLVHKRLTAGARWHFCAAAALQSFIMPQNAAWQQVGMEKPPARLVQRYSSPNAAEKSTRQPCVADLPA